MMNMKEQVPGPCVHPVFTVLDMILYVFSPVRGRYLAIYSYTDTRFVICEFEIYGTLSEWPGKMHIHYTY